MTRRNGPDILRAQRAEGRRVCVGIDPMAAKIPGAVADDGTINLERVRSFCTDIVDQVGGVAAAVKPNMAFFGQFGWQGMEILFHLVDYTHIVAPQLLVIGDGKRGDVGKTAEAYKAEADAYGFDAVTLNGYLGVGTLMPFLRDPNFVVFGLCKTSNPESGEFQDRMVGVPPSLGGGEEPLYLYLACQFMRAQRPNGALVGLVAGATYPEHITHIRRVIGPEAPLLVPGIGDQAGDLEAAMRAAGPMSIVNSSGGIIFSGRPREKTIELHDGVSAALSAA